MNVVYSDRRSVRANMQDDAFYILFMVILHLLYKAL